MCQKFRADKQKCEQNVHKIERALTKLKRKDGKASPILPMLQHVLDQSIEQKLKAESAIGEFEKAIGLLDQHSWERDPLLQGAMSASTVWGGSGLFIEGGGGYPRPKKRREYSNTLKMWVLVDPVTGVATPDPNQAPTGPSYEAL
jgi:hypothetical protein